MPKHIITLAAAILLTACANPKTPTISGNPQTMSADTLCYRHAGARHNQAIADEIKARRLNCAQILESDPLYRHD
jgi:uncharacterized lipoprotein YajG